jgi:hypothetical protein
MDWHNAPIGTIRKDELLNTLLAIWKTQYSSTNQYDSTRLSEAYTSGFEEGLDAIAQAAGLTEAFESGKACHRSKIRAKLDAKVEIIEGQTTLVKAG